MSVFVDTAAFYALLSASDARHDIALWFWKEMLLRQAPLFTSNYVILECTALIQNRLGLDKARLLHESLLPVVQTLWVGEEMHQQAVDALLRANRRDLSLVDCSSFAVMRRNNLAQAFTFDSHFKEQGFTVLP